MIIAPTSNRLQNCYVCTDSYYNTNAHYSPPLANVCIKNELYITLIILCNEVNAVLSLEIHVILLEPNRGE